MMPLLMQKTLRPWNQIDAIYWLNPKGREYFRCLKIILDFTDDVSSNIELCFSIILDSACLKCFELNKCSGTKLTEKKVDGSDF